MTDFTPWFNANRKEDTVNAEAVADEPASPVVENSAVGDEQTAVEEGTVTESADGDAQPSDAPRGKRKAAARKKAAAFPHVDAAVASKIRDMFDALEDEKVLAAAKALCDTNKSDPSALIDLLTDTKTRRTVVEFSKFADKLQGSETDDRKMLVVFAIMNDKNLPRVLFGVLNALAPGNGFGRPSNDPMKDAASIADHWGDGVDLSSLDVLKV